MLLPFTQYMYNNTNIKHNWVKQSPMFELMQLTWNVSDEKKKKKQSEKQNSCI